MTITEKRAEVYKEWRLAIYANDSDYYNSIMAVWCADGNTKENILKHLQNGYYDDDIMEIINTFKRAKKCYGGAGWYISNDTYFDEYRALKTIADIEGKLPTRIYKNKIVY